MMTTLYTIRSQIESESDEEYKKPQAPRRNAGLTSRVDLSRATESAPIE